METGTYPLHAWVEDDDGAVYPLNGMLEVQLDQQTAVGEEDRVGLPERSELAQNFPNPFNSETVIRFALAKPGTVDLGIYSTAGQRLATLVNGEHLAGSYVMRWDGRGDDDRALASGVYLYRLSTDGRQMLRKLLLVR